MLPSKSFPSLIVPTTVRLTSQTNFTGDGHNLQVHIFCDSGSNRNTTSTFESTIFIFFVDFALLQELVIARIVGTYDAIGVDLCSVVNSKRVDRSVEAFINEGISRNTDRVDRRAPTPFVYTAQSMHRRQVLPEK